MVRVLLPVRLLQEAAACAMLGAALGAVRAFLPARGRAAFVPDVLLSGVVLLVCQSYAAGYSAAGVLRWYMVAAAFAAANGVVVILEGGSAQAVHTLIETAAATVLLVFLPTRWIEKIEAVLRIGKNCSKLSVVFI